MAIYTASSYSKNLGESSHYHNHPVASRQGQPDDLCLRKNGWSLDRGSKGYSEGELERPRWAGVTPLSCLVATLNSFKPLYGLMKLGNSFKPLYGLMKLGARQVFISTAEKSNVPWRAMAKEILQSDVYKAMESIENRSLVYLDYYLKPFHAYEEGNLCWLVEAEFKAATLSMEKRSIPEAPTVEEATEIARGNWLQKIEQHHNQYSVNTVVKDILDIGCSVGVSTRFLADKFPSEEVTGLDLSPYFLAVAQ